MCDLDAIRAEIDAARACASGLGIGVYATRVIVVTQTWTGGARGEGVLAEDSVEILPRPKVRQSTLRYRADAVGKHTTGDFLVSAVSLGYDEDMFTDEGLTKAQQRHYLLNGKPFRLTSEPVSDGLGWSFRLSRMATRPEVSTVHPFAIFTIAGDTVTTLAGDTVIYEG